MEEEKTGETRQMTAEEAWHEVGRQFQALGESLAAALRASWRDPEHRERVETMQDGLEAKVKDLDAAIQDALRSPQAQQAKADAKKAAESLREAGEQTVLEIRPHLVSALKQLSNEINRMIGSMEGSDQAEEEAASPDKDPAARE